MFRKAACLRKLAAFPNFPENLRRASSLGSSNSGDNFGDDGGVGGGRNNKVMMNLGQDLGVFESGKRRNNVLAEKVVR